MITKPALGQGSMNFAAVAHQVEGANPRVGLQGPFDALDDHPAAVVAAHEADDLTRLDFAGGSILVARRPEAVGHRLRCRIHARDVSLALDKPQASSILNVFRATVSAIAATDTPGQVLVQLYVGATPLLARITERSRRVLDLEVGREVWAQVKAVALLA